MYGNVTSVVKYLLRNNQYVKVREVSGVLRTLVNMAINIRFFPVISKPDNP